MDNMITTDKTSEQDSSNAGSNKERQLYAPFSANDLIHLTTGEGFIRGADTTYIIGYTWDGKLVVVKCEEEPGVEGGGSLEYPTFHIVDEETGKVLEDIGPMEYGDAINMIKGPRRKIGTT